MDFSKILNVAILPAVALVILAVVGQFLGLIPFIGWLLAILLIPLTWLIILYAGYTATKSNGLDLISAGLVGVVASLAAGVVGFALQILISVVFTLLSGVTDILSIILGFGFGFIGFVIGLVIGAVIAFVLGLIGGFAGQKL